MNWLACFLLLTTAVVVSAQGPPYPWTHKCFWCVKNAQCIANSFCRCKPGWKGNGYFFCYKPALHVACEHCDDPTISTENGNAVSVPYVGASTLAVTTLDRPNGGECKVVTTTVTSRDKGKTKLEYVILKITVKEANGQTRVKRVRLCIVVPIRTPPAQKDIEYQIATGSGPESATVWTDDKTLSIYGEKTFSKVGGDGCSANYQVSDGGQLIFTFDCCPGMEIGTRPFVPFESWTLKSGVYVSTLRSKLQVLPIPATWVNYPICLNPGVAPSDVASDLGLTEQQALVYLALTGVTPGLPEVPPEQYQLADTLQNTCSRPLLQLFFNKVWFMFKKHEFINLISGQGQGNFSDLLGTLLKAAKWICDGSAVDCDNMMNDIIAKCGVLINDAAKYPDLNALVTNPRRCSS